MKTFISEGKHGIQWTACMQLEDLDLTDDQAQQMQVKTISVAATPIAGLNIHKRKTKILKYNTENTDSITFSGETLGQVETFMYLPGQHHR
ncbi:unnamed protein product [Schistosoma margrebowiei]|uniref:Uncharacterized protein n=1 Tax=Schistosoma margrebowiei TaxID=48269 RepID=A0A183LUG1_9TREM|nr:unnamed protein product [Schistosoma margrebowiei]